jgi:Mg-chelatase subunit ChlD
MPHAARFPFSSSQLLRPGAPGGAPPDAPVDAPRGAHDAGLRERVQAFVSADARRRAAEPQMATPAEARTHVLFVLDASGSMLAGKPLTVAGYNQQVDIVREQAQTAGATSVSLIVFSDTVRTLYAHQDVARLEHLSESSYRPQGATALLDALGAAIDAALGAAEVEAPGTAVLVALFTDGEENASRLHTGEALSECVRALEATGRFTFTLMGPREYLDDLASLLSIARGNIAGFDPTSLAGRSHALRTMAQATSTYMSLRAAGASASTDLYASANTDDAPLR